MNIGFRPGFATWWPGGLFGAPFFSLPVPVFFAISGYLAALRPPSPGKGEWKWLGRKLSRLLPPYFAWNAVLIATGALGPGLSAADGIFFFLFGARQLYFVCVLIQLVALYALMRRTPKGERVFFGASFALSAAFYVAADFATWTSGVGAEVFEARLNRFFPGWGVFFAAGVLLGRSESAFAWVGERRNALAALAAVSFVAFLGELLLAEERFGFHPIGQFFLAGLPFQLAGVLLFLDGVRRLDLSGRARSLLARLAAAGPDTFGIYLAHVSVQAALFALWVAAGHDTADWWEVPLLAVASWAVCRAAMRLARRVARAALP